MEFLIRPPPRRVETSIKDLSAFFIEGTRKNAVIRAIMAQKHIKTAEDRFAPHPLAEADKAADFGQLLQSVGRHKDREAFIILFEHFAPRIKSFLMKGGADPETADDLAQETMLTIWNKAETYNPKQAAPSTWIFTIARNKRIDALRKIKYDDPGALDETLIADDAAGPAQNFSEVEQMKIIAKALKSLPADQADLVRKSFFEDKSHGQIAEETGIPLGTVKSRIRLALERLRSFTKIKDLGQ